MKSVGIVRGDGVAVPSWSWLVVGEFALLFNFILILFCFVLLSGLVGSGREIFRHGVGDGMVDVVRGFPFILAEGQ